MRNQNNRNALFFIQFAHSTKNLFSSVWIQHRGWFIKNNAFRLHSHHSGNCNPLFLATRKLIRRVGPV